MGARHLHNLSLKECLFCRASWWELPIRIVAWPSLHQRQHAVVDVSIANRTQGADHRKNSKQLELVSSSSLVTIKHRNEIFLRFFCFGLWDQLRFSLQTCFEIIPSSRSVFPLQLLRLLLLLLLLLLLAQVGCRRVQGEHIAKRKWLLKWRPHKLFGNVYLHSAARSSNTCTITFKKDVKHKMLAVEYHDKRTWRFASDQGP